MKKHTHLPTLAERLQRARREIREKVMYQDCPKCEGAGCMNCNQTGCVPYEHYPSAGCLIAGMVEDENSPDEMVLQIRIDRRKKLSSIPDINLHKSNCDCRYCQPF